MSEDTATTRPETSASTTPEVSDVAAVDPAAPAPDQPADEAAQDAVDAAPEAVDGTASVDSQEAAAEEAAAPEAEAAAAVEEAAAPEAAAVESPEAPVEEAGEAPPEVAEETPSAEAASESAEATADDTASSEAPAADPIPEVGPIADLHQAMQSNAAVRGKVIGWNNGGFHVLAHEITAFCPRSEMEVGKPKAPASYLDKEFDFRVLEIQKAGRRVVISRAAELKKERTRRKAAIREKVTAGKVLKGRIASLTDFGAFVDLGGVQGLVHVSQIRRERVQDPRDLLEAGQEVTVKVLKVEQGGKRISLSMKALEPDPWDGVDQRFEEGAVVNGTVEKTASFGAFVALEPGLTGLLPSSGLSLPRGASLARIFPRGKQVSVQILRVDPKRRRISLALEGSKMEGSRSDYEKYVKGQSDGSSQGFNALAAAFEKLQDKSE